MKSDKASEFSDMSASAEASTLIRLCAEPVSAGESVKALIRKASRRAGMSFGRARALWYAEARVVRAEEMDALRKAARVRNEDAARGEYADLLDHIREIKSRLAQIEQNLDRA